MIPENAKIVFEGNLYRIYQWDQLLFDGSHAVFEKVWRQGSCEVVCTRGDKIVLAYQMQPHKSKPFYSLFGGRVDHGEAPIDAAHRELKEESGFKTDNMIFYSEYPMHGYDSNTSVFVAKEVYPVSEQALEPGEKIQIIEKTFDEFLEIMLYDNFRTNREFLIHIMRLKIDGKIEEFRNTLFGK